MNLIEYNTLKEAYARRLKAENVVDALEDSCDVYGRMKGILEAFGWYLGRINIDDIVVTDNFVTCDLRWNDDGSICDEVAITREFFLMPYDELVEYGNVCRGLTKLVRELKWAWTRHKSAQETTARELQLLAKLQEKYESFNES